ncbi:hypothetical protein PFISCL1PPCAC_14244, partial [Pristionchus fissidentatus]
IVLLTRLNISVVDRNGVISIGTRHCVEESYCMIDLVGDSAELLAAGADGNVLRLRALSAERSIATRTLKEAKCRVSILIFDKAETSVVMPVFNALTNHRDSRR